MKRVIRLIGGLGVAGMFTVASAAAAPQAGENPFAVPAKLTCAGESIDVVVVGIPQAAPESEAAGRPGIAFVVDGTTRLVPKSISFERYVNGVLRATGSQQWGFGVPDLTTCSQVIEFNAPNGNAVRIELEFQVIVTPAND